VLAAAGVAIGLWLARAGNAWLTAQLGDLGLQLDNVTADWRTAVIGVAAGAVTAFVCGVAPALNAGRVSPAETLKAGAPQHTSNERSQRVVVAAQLAVSLVVVVVGTLLFRGYYAFASAAEPLQTDRTMVVDLRFWRSTLAESRREAALTGVLDALAALPGTVAAAGNNLPMIGGGYIFPFDLPGADATNVLVNSVSAQYLGATGAMLLAGRGFSPGDVAGAPMVGVVNRQFARRYLGGEARVPQMVWRRVSAEARQAIEIVGVIEDQASDSLMEAPEAMVLLHRAQDMPENFNAFVLVRSTEARQRRWWPPRSPRPHPTCRSRSTAMTSSSGWSSNASGYWRRRRRFSSGWRSCSPASVCSASSRTR
jgi:hypothetical protein